MLKAVLFDFGQTLVDSAGGFRAAEKRVQRQLFERLDGVPWDDFIEQYRGARTRYQKASNFSRRELWRAVLAFWGDDPDELLVEQWETQYWAEVRRSSQPFPETERVLNELQAEYRLGLITNTQGQGSEGSHRMSRFPEFRDRFDTIVVAGEAGVPPKPDPLPFSLCLGELAVGRDEAVYVGDDWDIDIKGAVNAGIQAIWLKHHTVRRNWPCVATTVPVITSLEELLRLDELIRT